MNEYKDHDLASFYFDSEIDFLYVLYDARYNAKTRCEIAFIESLIEKELDYGLQLFLSEKQNALLMDIYESKMQDVTY